MSKTWTAVDRFFEEHLVSTDPALEAALAANRRAGLPEIDVTPLQGRFLELLVRMSGARRALEIGTLGGYSTLWMARALPEGGSLLSLELDPRHAEVARGNLKAAGVAGRVEVRVGRALDSLDALIAAGSEPFDLIFIDADKSGYPGYLDRALKLARPGTVIVGDNVVREGKVANAASRDANVQGVRRFAELVGQEPRLRATVLQTVSTKGYDGFLVAVVIA
ncbi:MAG TPA: O-methyltransferase [Terracidiphilus sp.]|nr:O-methyltransferase [Terracidiphilus sp.]